MKILFVMPTHISCGGIESVAMNLWHEFIRQGHMVDFVCHGEQTGTYEKEIMEQGSNVYHIPIKGKKPYRTIKAFEEIVKNGNYDVVHAHMNATAGIYLKIADKYGVKILVAHSHAASMRAFTSNPIKMIINYLEKIRTNKHANIKIACSNRAGKWLYGNDKYFTILNAVDVKKFMYSEKTRNEKRRELGLNEKEFVIIHVGSFLPVKNHSYLIDIMSEVRKTNKMVKLILVGDGKLKQDIENKIREQEMKDTIMLLGQRRDINELLQAADMFVLPSFSEGNPVALSEAATSGLHCLVSNEISADIAEYFAEGSIEFLPIYGEKAFMLWEKKIIKKWERIQYSEKNPCGLSSETMAKQVERLYLNKRKETQFEVF